MINQDSVQAVKKATTHSFVRPLYESYCFSRIPDTIKCLFGLEGKGPLPGDCFSKNDFEDVLLIFVDGFGWCFFEAYADQYPFLSRMKKEGTVSKITSQFPSTTAGHVTCMNTGLPVAETGIYEWFQYDPIADGIILPLVFSYAGDKEAGTLVKEGILPESIFPFPTFYSQLKGVESFILMDAKIVNSTYSNIMYTGANKVGYESLGDAVAKFTDLLKSPSKSKRYFYLYISDIDSAGHRHGTYSEEFRQTVKAVFDHLESFFSSFSPRHRRTLMLMTADHGMIDVDPMSTYYLNSELPAIKHYLKTNRKGDYLAPAGSCRDFFLHIKEEVFFEAKELLENSLKDMAQVVATEDLIKEGLFGPRPPSKQFTDRVGNLVILPIPHNGVWWHEKNRFSQNFYAVHGGLSQQEMETIFAYLEL